MVTDDGSDVGLILFESLESRGHRHGNRIEKREARTHAGLDSRIRMRLVRVLLATFKTRPLFLLRMRLGQMFRLAVLQIIIIRSGLNRRRTR